MVEKHFLNITSMDINNAPKKILKEYINKISKIEMEFDVYIVWSCKTLQNRKWILATNLPDNKLYELTYNGDKKEYYLDEYDKLANTVVVPV